FGLAGRSQPACRNEWIPAKSRAGTFAASPSFAFRECGEYPGRKQNRRRTIPFHDGGGVNWTFFRVRLSSLGSRGDRTAIEFFLANLLDSSLELATIIFAARPIRGDANW